jgi:Tfp pilus assembly protein PilF
LASGILFCGLTLASVDHARQLLERGDHAQAERELLDALGHNPDAPDANFLLGVLYTRTARCEKGRPFLLKALALEPGSATVLNNLGVNALGRAREGEAEQYFLRALAIDGRAPDTLFNLGLIRLKHNQFEEAERLLDKASAVRPNDPEILRALLAAAIENGSTEAMGSAAGALMAAGPKDPAFYVALAKPMAAKARYEPARAVLERARSLFPESREVAYNLAVVQFLSGDARAARELAEGDLKNGERPELYNLLGDVYENLGLHAEAAEAYRSAVRLDPSNAEYSFNLGYEFLIHHNFDLAENIFRTSLRKFPKALKLHLGLSAAYFGRVQYAEAIEAVSAGIDAAPESLTGYFFLARAFATLAGQDERIVTDRVGQQLRTYVSLRPGEALPNYTYALYLLRRKRPAGAPPPPESGQLLRRAVELDSRFGEAYLELGKLQFAAGDYYGALERFERAAALNPALPQAWYEMGRTYAKLGQPERAREAWDQHADRQKQLEADAARREKQILRFVYTLK